jgi:hypothetical protein
MILEFLSVLEMGEDILVEIIELFSLSKNFTTKEAGTIFYKDLPIFRDKNPSKTVFFL